MNAESIDVIVGKIAILLNAYQSTYLPNARSKIKRNIKVAASELYRITECNDERLKETVPFPEGDDYSIYTDYSFNHLCAAIVLDSPQYIHKYAWLFLARLKQQFVISYE